MPRTVKHIFHVERLEDRTTPATVYALDANGLNLLRFDSATPSTMNATVPVSGLVVGGATESLAAIDFRPANGRLYALGVNTPPTGGFREGRLYTLDPATGIATVVGPAPFSTRLAAAARPDEYGFDFNPIADAIRVVNNEGQNFRVSPNTGALVALDGPLVFSADPDLIATPGIVAAAYTNNTATPIGNTTLFVLDAHSGRLLTLEPPNVGTLNDVGPLGVRVSENTGFDIAADGTAYASLTPVGVNNSQLATVSLTTGAATLVGVIGGGSLPVIRDIAIRPVATVAFAAATAIGAEGSTATFIVTRFGDTTGTVSVDVAATGGTATAGADYTGLPTTITFNPGETSKTVLVGLTDDANVEGIETVVLTLLNATGGSAAGKLTSATLTLSDPDTPDTTAPTVTVEQADGQVDPTSTVPVRFTVTFSEPVVGFDAADVVLGGAAATGASTTVTGSSTTYTVSVVTTTPGQLSATVPATVATDPAGNPNAASSSTDNTVTVNLDTTAPTVGIAQAVDQADPATTTPVRFTVVFSEPVTGFSPTDVALSGPAASGATVTVSGSGTTYTVFVTPGPDGLLAAAILPEAAIDAAGNAASGSPASGFDTQVTVDATAPTVIVAQADGQLDPAPAGPVTFTATFSEPVTGFDATDLTLGGPAAVGATATVSGSGASYIVRVSVVTSGALSVSLPGGAATDAAGNPSAPSTATDNQVTVNLIPVDTLAPTVTVDQAADQPDPTTVPSIRFTVVFSEPVTGFTGADVVLSGNGATGATASVAGSGTTYTITVTGVTRAGPVRVDVPGGAASDAAGNLSLASTGPDNQVVFSTGLPVRVGDQVFAVGSGAGMPAQVTVYDHEGDELFHFDAFGGFTGGVRVATGDFNADGVVDIAYGTGAGIANAVKVLDGKTRTHLLVLQPFEPAFDGGVFVAAGDVTGDGRPELIVSPDLGGGPRVRVFDGNGFGQITDFLGIEDASFRGGARVAVGDVNGDSLGDVVVAAGFGGGPRIAVFDGSRIDTPLTAGILPPKLFGDFFVFEPTLRNGVYVAAGDLTGGGFADIIAGGGPGGGPRVFAVSGSDMVLSHGKTQTQVANFFAGDRDNRKGVRVAIKDLDGDLRADLVTGAGEDEPPIVVGYAGLDTPPTGTPPRLFDINVFRDSDDGVYVG